MNEKEKQYYDVLDSIKDQKSRTDILWDEIVSQWQYLTEHYPEKNASQKVRHIVENIGTTTRLKDIKLNNGRDTITFQGVINILKKRGVYTTATGEEGGEQ